MIERRALVFTGGKAPIAIADHTLLPSYTYICAADSGLDTALTFGFRPDFAIGDFDSLSSLDKLNGIPHEAAPRDKDLTDTELLLKHINSMGIASYILIGGGEGRLDHLVHLFSLFGSYGPPDLWLTAAEQLNLVRTTNNFSLPLDTTCSVIPAVPAGLSKVSSTGLLWELCDFRIDSTRQSISNRSKAPVVSISNEGSPVFFLLPS
ncbi:MAG: thiamine diphosphokinase [Spirochaetae bacterium HGW-Spirochaetae-8]|nr:MAG: thiamine diphosphokinase [Spirochaetae bacterium HGW-Spirochaetae-8]